MFQIIKFQMNMHIHFLVLLACWVSSSECENKIRTEPDVIVKVNSEDFVINDLELNTPPMEERQIKVDHKM